MLATLILLTIGQTCASGTCSRPAPSASRPATIAQAPAYAFAAPAACNTAGCRAVPVASLSARRKARLGIRRGR